MKICVFCSANSNIEPVYFEKTKELGEWCAKNGHSIVFGGCDMGLMECVTSASDKRNDTLRDMTTVANSNVTTTA